MAQGPGFSEFTRMREVVEDQDAARRKGDAAAARVREAYTWDHVARRIRDRLTELG